MLKIASEKHGVTPGGLARRVLIDFLESNQEEELREVKLEVRRLREEISAYAEGLIATTADKSVTPDQVRDWMQKNIRSMD